VKARTNEVSFGSPASSPVGPPTLKVTVEYLTVPRDGEKANGDAGLVRRSDDGLLIVVLDALGHGEKAAAAAEIGLRYLAEAPLVRGLRPIIDVLHEKLRGSRGAAGMLLLVRGNHLEGCGVGNVGLRSYRAKVPAMLTPGVLGGSMNRLYLFHADLSPGDRIVLFSDGITARFDEEASKGAPALATCRAIMERHRRSHDDATVLVADFEAQTSVEDAVSSGPSPATSERAP
jgi:negative regulator of sigma-B (phosphoserine phosphatase)